MKYSQATINALIAAAECALALAAPYREGLATMEGHGFDNSNRFDLSASEFAHAKQVKALALVEAEK